MTDLYVAAGGGGDALAAALLGAGHIATISWDRLLVDPVPGPRGWDGFTGLASHGQLVRQVTSSTQTLGGDDRSTLPRLATEISAELFLLDMELGAVGLRHQLEATAERCGAERIQLVDVGGDILGTGEEPGLRSPLADGIVAGGALLSEIPTSLIVAGPGLDGELDASWVASRAKRLGCTEAEGPSPTTITRLGSVLDWHPTEASALWVAAALGIRGLVETRRGDRPLSLQPESAATWLLKPSLADLPVAQALAATRTFDAAARVAEAFAPSEIAYEEFRSRVAKFPLPTPNLYAARRLRESIEFITWRRLNDAAQVPGGRPGRLLRESSQEKCWPLLSLSQLAASAPPC